MNTVLSGVQDEIVDRVVSNLGKDNIVLVHTSKLLKNFDGFSEDTIKADLTKSGLANVITDFLSELAKRVLEKQFLSHSEVKHLTNAVTQLMQTNLNLLMRFCQLSL